MNSPGSPSSPSYRNLRHRNKQSPLEIKEKLRKSYKEKIQSSRSLLFNSMRGAVVDQNDLRSNLTDIYQSMFNFKPTFQADDEELEVLDEIRNELIEEEFEWWLAEYDRCQSDNIDWSEMELDNNVICPVCQKVNLHQHRDNISCSLCNYSILTSQNLSTVKHTIMSSIERHSQACNSEVQFTVVPESNLMHIYLVCAYCVDVQWIV